MKNETYKHSEITQQIIGCAMRVHSFMGIGFPEIIYQKALALELSQLDLDYVREVEVPIYYKDFTEPIGFRRVDFLVEHKVLVELKAVGEINDAHYAQVLNYLTAYKLEVALLINFGEKSLRFKRFVR